ncbi:MAG: rhomboid family intramembrane serine protease [Thiobacillaceae bacterium]
MPPITFALITVNILVYGLERLTDQDIIKVFGLWALNIPGAFHPWQLLTYGFLHGSILHLTFNMFAIWMFGSALERKWGDLRYLLTYLLSVVTAAITHVVITGYLMRYTGPVIGASGGAFGLMLAYALYFPNHRIVLVIPAFSVRARLFVLGYATIELLLGILNSAEGVAHFAHLGGLYGGWLGVQYFRGRGLFGVRKRVRQNRPAAP